MTIEQIQNDILEDFSLLPNWEERYEYMIDLGKNLPPIAPEYKDEKHLIKGCQSQVWLHADYQNGKMLLSADSDAIITKGIIAILIRMFSGQTPENVLNAKLDFIDQLGLAQHLSPTRANGLRSMLEQIRLYAQAFLLTKK